jgi:hypothetical protein
MEVDWNSILVILSPEVDIEQEFVEVEERKKMGFTP